MNDVDNDDTLDRTKPSQIFRKISALTSLLKSREEDLKYAIDSIGKCLRNEELLPPPEGLSSSVIVFTFKHPDDGQTYTMRGIGVTARLHKKRNSAEVCYSDSRTFPNEKIAYVNSNPCIDFYQTRFRKYPKDCNYGRLDVGWITSPAFGGPLDESDTAKLNEQFDLFAPINVRAPTKKSPCRTK